MRAMKIDEKNVDRGDLAEKATEKLYISVSDQNYKLSELNEGYSAMIDAVSVGENGKQIAISYKRDNLNEGVSQRIHLDKFGMMKLQMAYEVEKPSELVEKKLIGFKESEDGETSHLIPIEPDEILEGNQSDRSV